jgi:hypothetical protein
VTLHPRVVAAARTVLLVSTGDGKADAIGQAWADGDVRRIPARAARRSGAIWLLDAGAARNLPARDTGAHDDPARAADGSGGSAASGGSSSSDDRD